MPGPGNLRDRFARLSREERVLLYAVLASVLIHALVLSIQFRFPDRNRFQPLAPMEVVIVNSKTKSRPTKAQVLAQANLDGGGETEAPRTPRTPMPAMARNQAGDAVIAAQRRVQELEAEQRQLLSQISPKAPPIPAAPTKAEPEPQPPQLRGSELANRALAMAKTLEAQVSRQVDEYAQRPKKTFIGARAAEYRFAQYVDEWRQKVERVGNLNYPDAARGKIYGSLRLAVSINADGTLASVEVERSSGQEVLDRAAERIVRMAAPYARFPPDIRRDTDVLVITRAWNFAQGDRLFGD